MAAVFFSSASPGNGLVGKADQQRFNSGSRQMRRSALAFLSSSLLRIVSALLLRAARRMPTPLLRNSYHCLMTVVPCRFRLVEQIGESFWHTLYTYQAAIGKK
jgi:hypothetical protein